MRKDNAGDGLPRLGASTASTVKRAEKKAFLQVERME